MQWNSLFPHVRHLTKRDQDRIKEAFDLGEKSHGDQKRKSGELYFTHPIWVAGTLADMGADADTIIAALLHDTVEDTPLTLEEIDTKFNGHVATLIEGVTKLSKSDVADTPDLDEQIETLRKMFTLMEKDVRIMVIKLIDRLHNMLTAEFLPTEKRQALATQTMEVYVKIADRLCMQDIRDELEGLCISVLEPEIFAQLLQLRESNEKKVHEVLRTMDATIGSPSVLFQFEPTTWERRRSQLATESGSVTGKTPLSIAVICDSVDVCYAALGQLHQHWQRELLSFQDFINSPAINGYRGLHTTIIMPDGTRIRCKIRTKEMHEYARKGVTTRCFTEKNRSLVASLPWTQRIIALAEDTEGRSKEFWATLQSDILGESIVVHGPDDQTVQLPAGATALDGVFYLFGDRALHTQSIRIDGKNAAFHDPLPNVCSIEAVFARAHQVDLSWVDQTHTGLATALIRQALAGESRERKIQTGERILQEYLSHKGRGFLSEFNLKSLNDTLSQQGYGSLEKVYTQLAEGRISPNEVEETLFQKKAAERVRASVQERFTLRCKVASTNRRLLLEILQYYHVRSIRIGEEDHSLSYTCQLLLTQDEFRTLQFTLQQTIGVHSWSLEKSGALASFSSGVFFLFLLWGLDPVIARMLLHNYSVSPIDLTLVRFWSLTIMSGLLFLVTWLRSPIREARLKLLNKTLLLSVALLLMVSLTSYHSLQGTLPSHYTIPMTAAGVVLTSIVNKRRVGVLLLTWSLLIVGAVVLVMGTPDWTPRSMFFTFLALCAFTCFSIVSERYKRKERVDLRVAQYFFVLSLFCAIGTLPLLAISTLMHESLPLLAAMIGFSIVFAGLPYYMYYFLLSHHEIDFVLRFSFLIIFSTGLGEMFILGMPPLITFIGAGFVILGAMLPLVRIPQRWNGHSFLQDEGS